jgi:thioester reductase-like protein
VARALIAELRRIGNECALASFEVPWRVLVEWTEFSASNGLLTYSEKLQRRSVEERYRERLHTLYESLSTTETAAVSSAIDAVVVGNDAVDSLSAVRLQSVLRSKFAVDVSVAQLLQADSKEALLRIATTARAGGATDELSNELQSAVARDVELLAGMSMPPTSAALPPADAPMLVTGATGFVGSFVLERLLNGSVTLSVSCAETRMGDSLAVCGAVPELGSWSVTDAVPLATSGEAFPRWRCTLALPRGVDIEFKFVVRRGSDRSAEFESFGGNRRVHLPASVDCSVDCGTFGRLSAAVVRTSPLPSQVVALVRAPNDDQARQRLLDVLKSRSIAIADERVAALRVLAGDVALPQLGLPAGLFDELVGTVGGVVHCAATVNWLSTYAQLRDSNVIGTLNVLQFVRRGGGGFRKRLLHVSTIGVSAGVSDGDWLAPQQFVHSSGYNVTKWVAERLVIAHAAGDGGGGAVVVRPGMVSSHSRSGAHNASDYIPRYVRGCMQLGAFIDDGGARLEMIPVDWVAEQIGALALQGESGLRTVTLSNVARSPTYRAIARAARVEALPYARWQQRLHRDATVDNALYPLLTHFGAERLTMQWRVLDVAASMRWLAPTDKVDTRPDIDERALERLIRVILKK